MPFSLLAEDALKLIDRPDLKPAHRTLLKLTTVLMMRAEMSFNNFLSLEDPRITMEIEEYEKLPDRFKL